MQHVKGHAVLSIIEAVGKLTGLSLNDLLLGAPVSVAQIQEKSDNLHWNDFVELLRWLDQKYLLNWREVGEMCHDSPSFPLAAQLIRTAFSVKFALWVGFKWLGPSCFQVIKGIRFESRSNKEITHTLKMVEGFQPSPQLFKIFSGTTAAVPEKLFGLQKALVEVEISGNQATYIITVPEQLTWWSWIRNRLKSIFSVHSLLEELSRQQEKIHQQNLLLLNRQEEFKSLIDHFPDGVAIHRQEKVVYVNPSMVSYLGYSSSDEIVGRSIYDFVHADLVGFTKKRIQGMASGRVQPLGSPVEYTFVRKSGEKFLAEVAGVPITFDKELCMAVVARDLTDRKKLQAHLILSDRMTALGRLAAGVGHEINNPLFYVSMNVEKLESDLQDIGVHQCDEQIQNIQRGLSRIQNIVRDLKTVSQNNDEGKPANVDINSVLRSALSMAQNEIQHRAHLRYEPMPVPRIWINETRLSQVLLNIIINAAQSITPGRAEDNEIHIRTYVDESDQVVAEIRDTGKGMSSEVQKRIFDPFYSTKPIGEGTGLGLSICHSIVKSFKGSIHFESDLGKGTLFRISFPISKYQDEVVPRNSETKPAIRRGRVLIIDDEEELLEVVQDLLSEYHDCKAFSDARKALELIENNESFDCILCDLMMPKMSGIEFYERLKVTSPDLLSKLIFITGGSFTIETNRFLQRPEVVYCEKPIRSEKLLALINSKMIQNQKTKDSLIESSRNLSSLSFEP